MGLRARLDQLGGRWPLLRRALAVQERYGELNGGELASAVTLAAFLSVFPLIIVGIAVFGFFSAASSQDLPREVISNLGLEGKAAEILLDAMRTARTSRASASLVGLIGLTWTGLGLVRALQYAWDAAWQVRNRGFRDRLRGLGWLVGAGLLLGASFSLTASLRFLSPALAPVGALGGFALGIAAWLWTAKVLPSRDVGWRPLLPGAVVGAVGLELLKAAGSYWVPEAVSRSSALYGSLGLAIALLAWLLVFGRLVVYTAMLEVVLWEERNGTVELAIEVPAQPGIVPVAATRAGQRRLAPPPSVGERTAAFRARITGGSRPPDDSSAAGDPEAEQSGGGVRAGDVAGGRRVD
jgi:YihY family inner membrane protein